MAWLVWVHFAETISQHVAALTQQHLMLREDSMRSPIVMKLEAARVVKCYEALEARLSTPIENRDYLLTSGFSAADISVGQAVYMARHFAKIEPFPELSAWRGADEVAIFGAATEGFSKANINATIAESLERFVPVVAAAKAADIPVRGYVSCVTVCPYEGDVDPDQAAKVAGALFDMGCYEVSLGDTVGKGTPEQTDAMLHAVLGQVPAAQLAGHFHDTNGRALDNIEVALEHGLRVFDAAVGGLGGCPYAPGAAGNVATEAVEAHLRTLGFETGLNAAVIAKAAEIARAMRAG
ncbi:3-hydroxymethyl-3-methylglutaryl-CoA lyase, cytoplasmic [Nymphon striatum]|nr:3-hydroxymethyl-3-methylglutaryl-CoA lyase, cytoplasmic [Nymphon striatum]